MFNHLPKFFLFFLTLTSFGPIKYAAHAHPLCEQGDFTYEVQTLANYQSTPQGPLGICYAMGALAQLSSIGLSGLSYMDIALTHRPSKKEEDFYSGGSVCRVVKQLKNKGYCESSNVRAERTNDTELIRFADQLYQQFYRPNQEGLYKKQVKAFLISYLKQYTKDHQLSCPDQRISQQDIAKLMISNRLQNLKKLYIQDANKLLVFLDKDRALAMANKVLAIWDRYLPVLKMVQPGAEKKLPESVIDLINQSYALFRPKEERLLNCQQQLGLPGKYPCENFLELDLSRNAAEDVLWLYDLSDDQSKYFSYNTPFDNLRYRYYVGTLELDTVMERAKNRFGEFEQEQMKQIIVNDITRILSELATKYEIHKEELAAETVRYLSVLKGHYQQIKIDQVIKKEVNLASYTLSSLNAILGVLAEDKNNYCQGNVDLEEVARLTNSIDDMSVYAQSSGPWSQVLCGISGNTCANRMSKKATQNLLIKAYANDRFKPSVETIESIISSIQRLSDDNIQRLKKIINELDPFDDSVRADDYIRRLITPHCLNNRKDFPSQVQCKQKYPGLTISDKRGQQVIFEELKADRAVGLSLCSEALYDDSQSTRRRIHSLTGIRCGMKSAHQVTISGYSCQRGKLFYQIINSWGRDCLGVKHNHDIGEFCQRSNNRSWLSAERVLNNALILSILQMKH
jgi:hypothetical protein